MEEKTIRQNVKDSLFCVIFSDKKNALSLYNAINETEYKDEDKIEIVTLKDVIFIGYHNDVSIFFDSRITLWEHQSTVNYNMPLRGLVYYAECINGYLEKRGLKKKLYTNFIIILDEINGIRYSQNELDNGNLTAIQLVNYLRISYLQKNFNTLVSTCRSTAQLLFPCVSSGQKGK